MLLMRSCNSPVCTRHGLKITHLMPHGLSEQTLGQCLPYHNGMLSQHVLTVNSCNSLSIPTIYLSTVELVVVPGHTCYGYIPRIKCERHWVISRAREKLRDRQNNSFAQTTFSRNVQTEMENLGFHQEAMWCGLICELYETVDSAALSIEARITHLMSIRTFLLQHLDVGHFPPPSFVVKDMPMCQFEGILTNIDRRLQLYSMIEAGSHNQRAISSLDSENFFSAFQASQ